MCFFIWGVRVWGLEFGDWVFGYEVDSRALSTDLCLRVQSLSVHTLSVQTLSVHNLGRMVCVVWFGRVSVWGS